MKIKVIKDPNLIRQLDSPRGRRHDWTKVAEKCRKYPGEWVVVPGEPGAGYSTQINNGALKDFRPAGAYEATFRQGVLYVRATTDEL